MDSLPDGPCVSESPYIQTVVPFVNEICNSVVKDPVRCFFDPLRRVQIVSSHPTTCVSPLGIFQCREQMKVTWGGIRYGRWGSNSQFNLLIISIARRAIRHRCPAATMVSTGISLGAYA